jgi:hypothetical protein
MAFRRATLVLLATLIALFAQGSAQASGRSSTDGRREGGFGVAQGPSSARDQAILLLIVGGVVAASALTRRRA